MSGGQLSGGKLSGGQLSRYPSGTISESISHHLPIFSIFKGFDTEHKSNYQKKMINYDYCNSNVDMFVDQLSEKLNLNPPSDFCTFNKIYNDE